MTHQSTGTEGPDPSNRRLQIFPVHTNMQLPQSAGLLRCCPVVEPDVDMAAYRWCSIVIHGSSGSQSAVENCRPIFTRSQSRRKPLKHLHEAEGSVV
jgi:hypothetical protein